MLHESSKISKKSVIKIEKRKNSSKQNRNDILSILNLTVVLLDVNLVELIKHIFNFILLLYTTTRTQAELLKYSKYIIYISMNLFSYYVKKHTNNSEHSGF